VSDTSQCSACLCKRNELYVRCCASVRAVVTFLLLVASSALVPVPETRRYKVLTELATLIVVGIVSTQYK
jgi:hypothetical protein